MEKGEGIGIENASRLTNLHGVTAEEGEINASGHRQELHRNFGLLSICGVAITTGNTWVTVGGTIVNHF